MDISLDNDGLKMCKTDEKKRTKKKTNQANGNSLKRTTTTIFLKTTNKKATFHLNKYRRTCRSSAYFIKK